MCWRSPITLQVRGPHPPLGGNESLTSPFAKQKAASASPLPGLGKVRAPTTLETPRSFQSGCQQSPNPCGWFCSHNGPFPGKLCLHAALARPSGLFSGEHSAPVWNHSFFPGLFPQYCSWAELRSPGPSTPSDLPLPVACPQHRWGLFLTIRAILRLQNTLSHSSCTGINSCLPLWHPLKLICMLK